MENYDTYHGLFFQIVRHLIHFFPHFSMRPIIALSTSHSQINVVGFYGILKKWICKQ